MIRLWVTPQSLPSCRRVAAKLPPVLPYRMLLDMAKDWIKNINAVPLSMSSGMMGEDGSMMGEEGSMMGEDDSMMEYEYSSEEDEGMMMMKGEEGMKKGMMKHGGHHGRHHGGHHGRHHEGKKKMKGGKRDKKGGHMMKMMKGT